MSTPAPAAPSEFSSFTAVQGDDAFDVFEFVSEFVAGKCGDVSSPVVGFKGPIAPDGGELWFKAVDLGEIIAVTLNRPAGQEIYGLVFPVGSRVFASTRFPVSRAQALLLGADPALDRLSRIQAIIADARSYKAVKEARTEFESKIGPGAQPVHAVDYVNHELLKMLRDYDPDRKRPWILPNPGPAPCAFVGFVPA